MRVLSCLAWIAVSALLAEVLAEEKGELDSIFAINKHQITSSCKASPSYRPLIERIIRRNRQHLTTIPHWINSKVYARSLYRYGLDINATRVNTPIAEDVPVIADILASFVRVLASKKLLEEDDGGLSALIEEEDEDKFFSPTLSTNGVRYLEMGVSFGKTFFLATKAVDAFGKKAAGGEEEGEGVDGSVAVAFDAEDVNPVLVNALVEGGWDKKNHKVSAQNSRWNQPRSDAEEESEITLAAKRTTQISQWDLGMRLIRRGLPGTKIEIDRNTPSSSSPNPPTPVFYVAGDVVDRNSFSHIRSHNFNLIYSDAYHEGGIVVREFNNLLASGAISSEASFAMVWDDLEIMLPEFESICTELQSRFPASICHHRDIYGWLGAQEAKHTVGVFATDDLFELQCLFEQIADMRK